MRYCRRGSLRAVLLTALIPLGLAGCLNEHEQARIEGWLTCIECTGGQRDSVAAVAARKTRATTHALWDAFFVRATHGPDIVRRLAAEYDVSTDGSLPRDQFVDAYLADFEAGYQKRAALALGDIGDGEAIAVLRGIQAWVSVRQDVAETIRQAIEANSGAAAAELRALTSYPSVLRPGTEVAPVPRVQVVAVSGNPVAGVLVEFQPVDGTVARGSQRTNSSGVASAGGWTLGSSPGVQLLTAGLPGIPVAPVEFRVSVAGPPVRVDIHAGDGQSAPAGSVIGIPPAVVALDGNLLPVPDAEVRFIPTGDGSVAQSRSYTNEIGVTDAGLWRLRSTPGPDSLEAVTPIGSVVFTATALNVGPHSLDVDAGMDQVGFTGRPVPIPPRAMLTHAAGAAVGYAVQFTQLQGGGQVSGAIGRTDIDGRVGPDRWVLGSTPGPNLLRAASPGILDTALFLATAVEARRIALSMDSPTGFRIFLADETLDNLPELPTGPGNSITPSWSPDGNRIAFASDRTGDLEIYIIPADGSGPAVRITNDPGEDLMPSWSDDGTRIAFARATPGSVTISPPSVAGSSDIYTIRTDRTNEIRLTNGLYLDLWPAWSPGGGQIAFASNRGGNFDVYTMGIGGLVETNITNHIASDISPAWSPNGSRIAFSSGRAGPGTELWVMNRDGTDPVQVTDEQALLHSPVWAPDDSHLLYVGRRSGDLSPDLYLVLPDGSALRNLTGTLEEVVGVSIQPR